MTGCPMEERASAFGGGDLGGREEVVDIVRHMHGCAACRTTAGRHHRVSRLLAEMGNERAPASLSFEAILERMGRERRD